MRAKAWILALFIGMISLVGFGNNTADLVPNSKANTVVCFDTATTLVSVAILTDVQLAPEFEVQQLCTNYAIQFINDVQPVISFKIDKEIRPGLIYKQIGINENNPYLPKETKIKPDRTIDTKNSNQVAYRRARDGLREGNC